MLAPNPRSPIPYAVAASGPNTFATPPTYLSHRSVSQQLNPVYRSQADTPRNLQSGGALCISSPGSAAFPSNMAASAAYTPATTEAATDFPWPKLEMLNETLTCEGHPVNVNIHAKVEKGFFQAIMDQKWTCYRRNYFCVQCSYEISPNIDNGTMWIKIKGQDVQVQALGLKLAAVVDDSGGKNIPLVQHTAKRDAGPKSSISVVKVAPTPVSNRNGLNFSSQTTYPSMAMLQRTSHGCGVRLPLQDRPDNAGGSAITSAAQFNHQGYADTYTVAGPSHLAPTGRNTTHQFERVQFKQATANNGKRRASQQYFHLLVELMVDVRPEGTPDPVWVKIAQRVSEKIVVRGRSPSHYQNEGNHGSVSRNGSAGGAGGYGNSNSGGYGSTSTGAFRPTPATNYHGSLGPQGGFRSHDYAIPGGYGQSASPEGVDDGVTESNQLAANYMSRPRRVMSIPDHDGYQYYPSPLYESRAQAGLPPLAKIDGTSAYPTEARRYGEKSENSNSVAGAQWHANGCGRFQGVESSQGYYPNMSTGYS
nr:meiosis-specific transcription factor ndt80 [Quercus suber]